MGKKWFEDDFRNLTAKLWANLDNPIKRYDFSKVSLILCMWHSSNICDVTTVQLCNGTVHKFVQNFTFMKMFLPSYFILWYVRAEMNVHVCTYEWTWSKGLLISKKNEELWKIYVQSQWRVVLLWYHIFWQSSIQRLRGRHTQLCIITSLKRVVQILLNTFTVGFVKLLSTHPIHIIVWGNFPFNFVVSHSTLVFIYNVYSTYILKDDLKLVI